MSREDQLAELLERWEAASTTTNAATLAEFCRDCPELADDFRKLLSRLGRVNAMLGGSNKAASTLANEPMPDVKTGRYEAIKFHRKGGLGEVYVAKDGEVGRRVALKCMQKIPAMDYGSRQRFLVEAEITGKLEHPGIVPVYGLGQDANGKPYYAMRFISGRTLDEEIKQHHESTALSAAERNVELRRLLRHFIAVCETMAYAHDRGVVHRDLKPANIMIGPYGETLVVDWGLAKQIAIGQEENGLLLPPLEALKGGSAEVSMVGMAKGTPAYMSPEQARGDWPRVGPASDQYSLGSTLFALLTGRLPYAGRDLREVLDKVTKGNSLTPRNVNSQVPPALDAICRKAMSLHPEARYAGVGEYAKDIERWLADEPVSAWTEPFAVRARRWLRRHRTLVTSSVAVLLVSLFSAIALAVQERQSSNQVRGAFAIVSEKNSLLEKQEQELLTKNFALKTEIKQKEEAKNQAVKERDRAEENRQLAESRLYQSMMYLASEAMTKHEYERAAEFITKSAPQPGIFDDYRHLEWYRTWYALHKATVRTMKIAAKPSKIQISEDGSILVAACKTGTYVYRAKDGSKLFTLPNKFNSSFALTRDGRLLIFKDDDQLEAWRLPANGAPERLWRVKAFDSFSDNHFAMAAIGKVFATTNKEGLIRIRDIADGKVLHEFKQFMPIKGEFLPSVESVSISADGDWIWFSRFPNNPTLVRVADGAEWKPELMKEISYRKPEPVNRYNLRPFTESNRLYAQFGEDLWSWPLPPPSGGFTAFTARKQVIKDSFSDMWEIPVEGEDPMLYLYGSGRAFGIRSPFVYDSLPLQFQGILPRGQGEKRNLPAVPFRIALPRSVSAFTVRPDGKQLVCADPSGIVTFLDAANAAEPELLLRHPDKGEVVDLLFAPDGQLVSLSNRGAMLKAKAGARPDWDLQPEKKQFFFPPSPNPSMALSPDGRWFALRVQQEVEIINAENLLDGCSLFLKQFSLFARPAARVPLTFVPGVQQMIFATERDDGNRLGVLAKPSTLGVWDFGKFKAMSSGLAAIGGALAPGAVGQQLFAATARGIPLDTHVDAIDVSPDGKWVAAAGRDGKLRIWPLGKFGLKPTFVFAGSASLSCVRFAPDGRSVAAGASDGQVWVWSLDPSIPAVHIPAHTGAVYCLLYLNDGRTIVSGSGKSVKFLIRELPYDVCEINNGSDVRAFAIAPDGRSLAVGDRDGYVRLYRIATQQQVLEAARQRVQEIPENRDFNAQLLIALWGRYLELKKHNDPKAKDLLQEGLTTAEAWDEQLKIAHAAWLKAFRDELAKQ